MTKKKKFDTKETSGDLNFPKNCNYIVLAVEFKLHKMLTWKWVLQMINDNLR